ncbi:hypothetical protein [Methylocystis echinoides]|uniref:Uncharacterized protein n=1 Tax=Methylocystis echinoides TaxID=29468 RepID=A0A9W6GRC3_9HYPH|nr:hypothetical protein [Methylocystis echinoides]GLI91471.1 hypothetical protein LMG27198_04630 [Methylocystis echinoides]
MRQLKLRLPLLLLALASAPALAEETPSIISPEGEHFTLTPVEGGFMRLDKRSGAVSFCTAKEGVSVCRLGADERAALEAEIERLRAENARLKTAAAPPSTLPREEDFERALSFTERFLRRIMRLFREESSNDGKL